MINDKKEIVTFTSISKALVNPKVAMFSCVPRNVFHWTWPMSNFFRGPYFWSFRLEVRKVLWMKWPHYFYDRVKLDVSFLYSIWTAVVLEIDSILFINCNKPLCTHRIYSIRYFTFGVYTKQSYFEENIFNELQFRCFPSSLFGISWLLPTQNWACCIFFSKKILISTTIQIQLNLSPMLFVLYIL